MSSSSREVVLSLTEFIASVVSKHGYRWEMPSSGAGEFLRWSKQVWPEMRVAFLVNILPRNQPIVEMDAQLVLHSPEAGNLMKAARLHECKHPSFLRMSTLERVNEELLWVGLRTLAHHTFSRPLGSVWSGTSAGLQMLADEITDDYLRCAEVFVEKFDSPQSLVSIVRSHVDGTVDPPLDKALLTDPWWTMAYFQMRCGKLDEALGTLAEGERVEVDALSRDRLRDAAWKHQAISFEENKRKRLCQVLVEAAAASTQIN